VTLVIEPAILSALPVFNAARNRRQRRKHACDGAVECGLLIRSLGGDRAVEGGVLLRVGINKPPARVMAAVAGSTVFHDRTDFPSGVARLDAVAHDVTKTCAARRMLTFGSQRPFGPVRRHGQPSSLD